MSCLLLTCQGLDKSPNSLLVRKSGAGNEVLIQNQTERYPQNRKDTHLVVRVALSDPRQNAESFVKDLEQSLEDRPQDVASPFLFAQVYVGFSLVGFKGNLSLLNISLHVGWML